MLDGRVGLGAGNCIGGLWKGRLLFGVVVRSNVMVGNGADADIVAMFDEPGRNECVEKLEFRNPFALEVEPDNNIAAAAEVVDTIVMAAGGRGWLWVPSYVVIKIVWSSAHR